MQRPEVNKVLCENMPHIYQMLEDLGTDNVHEFSQKFKSSGIQIDVTNFCLTLDPKLKKCKRVREVNLDTEESPVKSNGVQSVRVSNSSM